MIVSFSFSSVSDEISAIFGPGVPSPSERLKTLTFFKNEGIACGMFLFPVIPFITDTPELMEETIKKYKIPPRIPLNLYTKIYWKKMIW